MKKLLAKTNIYFFGAEKIPMADALWFYGMYLVYGIFGLFFLCIYFIN